MRLVRLDETGFSNIDIRPQVFRTMQEDVALNKEIGRMSASKFPPMLPWTAPDLEAGKLSRATLNSFRDHDMIQIKRLDSLPGLASVNFTRGAFYSAKWDSFTTLARGLFVDTKDNSIVARGYPKFFNRNEREDTTDEALMARMKFPVDAFEKLNGFFCTTGFSERHGELVIASKSTIDGDFAVMAEEILRDTLGEGGMENLMRINRDQKASLVFEIEDPERDPHIIKLDKPNAVLISCIRRSEHFEQAPYDDLKKIANWIGCDVEQPVARLPNERALASFNHRVEQDPKWTYKGKQIEGVVLEDQDGQFCKLKSDFYRKWKFMRSAVNEIRRAKVKGTEPRMERFSDMPAPFLEFQAWAQTLSAKALESDIISLREAFEGDRAPMEAIEDDVVLPTPQDEKDAHFLKVIESIDANEKISEEGLARFIQSALDNPEKEE
ncbi:T4 RnlA family RNA ligase, partial [Parvibaculum sp.]|uniref:T4 RnlA family RNA ligase n=1 Tax=Parvibaculum sp. TaxID=2024848 RepID=UPI003297EA91